MQGFLRLLWNNSTKYANIKWYELHCETGDAILGTLYNKLKTFLLKDVSNEQETKELALLLRFLCILYIIYYLVSSVFVMMLSLYSLSVFLLLCSGILCSSFIFTYDSRTRTALRIYNLTLTVSSVILSIFSGWETNFQWSLLVPVMIIFFDINTTMKSKLQFARFQIIFFCCLAVLTHLTRQEREFSTNFSFTFQTFQTLFYGVTFFVIAYCFCTKFNQAENKLRKINAKLLSMASQDTLTGLPNRRNMNEHLQALVYEFNRTGKPFCIAIADVDLFKYVNDSYGHDTGDYVLTTLAEMLRSTMRGRGRAARWGGEEFLFCFEGMSGQQAYIILESLRMQIEKKKFLYKDHSLNITMTFGLEEYSQIVGVEATIAKADVKLYQGKTSGRNKVVF